MKARNALSLLLLLTAAYPPSAYGSDDIAEQLELLTNKFNLEIGIQINLSGRQRMLTQKMSKETLLIALGIDPEENRASLKKTIALFDKTLTGLQVGDPSQQLAKTTNTGLLAQLDKVAALWADFKPLVDAVAGGATDQKTLDQIADKNLPLLAEMNTAVSMYEKLGGADTAEQAVAINLSGRQRMLTQKMTKEFLMIARGVDVETNRQSLTQTMELFDKTLKGLLDGDKTIGLERTSDETIRNQLAVVGSLWTSYAPLLGKPADDANLRRIADANLKLLTEMDKAVKMYEQL